MKTRQKLVIKSYLDEYAKKKVGAQKRTAANFGVTRQRIQQITVEHSKLIHRILKSRGLLPYWQCPICLRKFDKRPKGQRRCADCKELEARRCKKHKSVFVGKVCPKCNRKRVTEWRKENPERHRNNVKNYLKNLSPKKKKRWHKQIYKSHVRRMKADPKYRKRFLAKQRKKYYERKMNCLSCKVPYIQKKGNIEFPSKVIGKIIIPNIIHLKCPQCNETLLPPGEGKKMTTYVKKKMQEHELPLGDI